MQQNAGILFYNSPL